MIIEVAQSLATLHDDIIYMLKGINFLQIHEKVRFAFLNDDT